MTYGREVVALLEKYYREGLTASWAAREAGVSVPTALRYFRKFRAAGIPGTLHERAPLRANAHKKHDPQKYTGPDWIGKRR